MWHSPGSKFRPDWSKLYLRPGTAVGNTSRPVPSPPNPSLPCTGAARPSCRPPRGRPEAVSISPQRRLPRQAEGSALKSPAQASVPRSPQRRPYTPGSARQEAAARRAQGSHPPHSASWHPGLLLCRLAERLWELLGRLLHDFLLGVVVRRDLHLAQEGGGGTWSAQAGSWRPARRSGSPARPGYTCPSALPPPRQPPP